MFKDKGEVPKDATSYNTRTKIQLFKPRQCFRADTRVLQISLACIVMMVSKGRS